MSKIFHGLLVGFRSQHMKTPTEFVEKLGYFKLQIQMKPALILLIATALCQIVVGQSIPEGPRILWDEPEFDSKKIERLNVKKIAIKSYQAPLTRGDNDSETEIRYFNSKGKLSQVIEMVSNDTLMTQTFHYNSRGVLGWKHINDKKWNRTYKEGYRFNGSQHVYQVKAYEMLRNDERMLLDTRQYTYDNDSLLKEVRILENNRVVSVHKFNYDKKFRVSTEVFEDGNDRILQKVDYKYDTEDRVREVALDKGVISVYRYEYNSKGQPMQIEWLEDGKTRGLVIYDYKSTGMVAQMEKILNPDTKEENHFIRVYNYN
ncbi:MAG: hypothetical protein MRZ79_01095 [Bacteroidia bacterium]|nr:hypothetical protein [Bacteroidia bacterium]